MNNRKNIELARKQSWISKREKKINPSMKKIFTTFFMDNWKTTISTLFTLCSIAIPFSYLNYINSNYLFYDALSSFKAWIGAFILFSIIITFVLVIPSLFPSLYLLILKSNLKDEGMLVKFNNFFILTPWVSIFIIITQYFFDYDNCQMMIIFIIMVLGSPGFCFIYHFKDVKTNGRLILNTLVFFIMICLIFWIMLNWKMSPLPSIFTIALIIYYFFKCMLLLIPDSLVEEKSVNELLKWDALKPTVLIAGSLLLFNLLFVFLYLMLILSILPRQVIFSFSIDEMVNSGNQIIYSIILILIYIIKNVSHNYLIKNSKRLNYTQYLKEIAMQISLVFLVLLIIIFIMPEYPNFIINPMRALGYIEDKRDARWYSIDNRFIEWNNLQALFLDKKIVYTQDQVCYKKDFDLSKLSKKEKIPFHLYGYMAWNTGNTRIFCPVSISIEKDIGSKCWHIPSQYINLIPKG